MFNQKSILNINILKLGGIQNSDENKILSISSCQKIRHIIIDDYKIVKNEYANVNDQSFI